MTVNPELICECCGTRFRRYPVWGPWDRNFCFGCVFSGAAYGESSSGAIDTTGHVVERPALPASAATGEGTIERAEDAR